MGFSECCNHPKKGAVCMSEFIIYAKIFGYAFAGFVAIWLLRLFFKWEWIKHKFQSLFK
jgi:hypothetical protein